MIHYLLAALVTKDELPIPKGDFTQTTLANVLQVIFGLSGGIALLIVTIAGLKYVLSSGDPQSINKAKDTILYALVGLIICILAFSIVSFTIGKVK